MNLLFIGDKLAGDDSQLGGLQRITALSGHSIKTSMQARTNATEVAMLAKSHKIDAVITSQLGLLEATLRQTVDFVPSRKAISIDNYAGSLLKLPMEIPLLIISPLERLSTVPYERWVLDRFISKLTQPGRWLPQTKFFWKQVTEQNAADCLLQIQAADLVAVDIETPGDLDRSIKLCGYGAYNFADNSCTCFVVHVVSEAAWHFMRCANDSQPAKIMQNGIYDNSYFLRWAVPVRNWLWDTMVMQHCMYSELPKSLDMIASLFIRDVRFWKDDGKTGSLEDEMRYNALDCWGTVNALLGMLHENCKWAADNYVQEFPMVFPSLHASLEGWKVDEEAFAKAKVQKEAEAERHLIAARLMLSEPHFNPRSPPQMNKLFELLGCKRGARDTNAAAFSAKARAASPLNERILGEIDLYKKASKLVSTYFSETAVWQGRLFYTLDPAATDTGRAAARASAFWCGYNIQNIPRGDAVKQALIADTGWLLAEPDKAQSEARCVGYLSGETKLIDLVESSHDYHSWNAQAFFGVPYEKIYDEARGKTLDKDLRDLSKRTNHGANYNMGAGVMLDTMGPKKVAEAKRVLKLPAYMRLLKVCEFLLETYEKTYPKVKGLFYDQIIREITISSKLVSPFGWTRFFFAKPSKSNKPALNAAVAHGPQNLSVGIVNREWYAIWRASVYGALRGRVRVKAQIHDSIPFQYREGDEAAAQEVLALMNTAVQVRGADGVVRTMRIPSDLQPGKKRWSDLK